MLSFMSGRAEAAEPIVPQAQRLQRAFARMMGTENDAGLRSNRGMKDYLLRELFRSMLRSRCSIPIEKFLPMLISDFPAFEELLLADFANDPIPPPARPPRRPTPQRDEQPQIERPQRQARNGSRPRNEGEQIPRRPKATPKARADNGYARATVREQLAEAARQAGLQPGLQTPIDEIDVNLTGGVVTPEQEPQNNYLQQLFSQRLSDFVGGEEGSDYDDHEQEYDDDPVESDSEQYVNFQFLQIEEICGGEAPIVGIPGLTLCPDENEAVDDGESFSHIFENHQCGSLPFTMMKIGDVDVPALLDSGSVFNMVRKDVVEKLGATIEEKEGRFTTGSGKGKTIGTTTIKVSLAERPARSITFTVVDQDPLEAISGYPLLRERNKLCLAQLSNNDEWTKSGDDLPPQHQKVLQQLIPSVPCRQIEHDFQMGEVVNATPSQEPMRTLNEVKANYLLAWIPKEVSSGLIEEGMLGDYLSQHYDKSKQPIPGEFRECLDASRVNRAFLKIPIAMPLILEIVSDLSRFPLKAVIDIKWAFTHMTLNEEQ